jgi:hypothetical protein
MSAELEKPGRWYPRSAVEVARFYSITAGENIKANIADDPSLDRDTLIATSVWYVVRTALGAPTKLFTYVCNEADLVPIRELLKHPLIEIDSQQTGDDQ